MLYIYKKELEWYERLAVDKESRQTESLGRAAKKYQKRLWRREANMCAHKIYNLTHQ